MFMAALFTIAQTWKQPKCPLTNELIRKFEVDTYMNIIEPLKKKKKETLIICVNKDRP